MPKITEVNLERAYDIIAELTNTSTYETSSTKVVTGDHPTLGRIHVVVPPLGNSLLLPVVVQNFAL